MEAMNVFHSNAASDEWPGTNLFSSERQTFLFCNKFQQMLVIIHGMKNINPLWEGMYIIKATVEIIMEEKI